MSEKIAAIVKRDHRGTPKGYPGVMGEATAYYLNPPLEQADWDSGTTQSHTYVWVSQAAPLGDWETYIFPADSEGVPTSWGELDGSRKGFISPDDLMRELGYEVIGQPEW